MSDLVAGLEEVFGKNFGQKDEDWKNKPTTAEDEESFKKFLYRLLDETEEQSVAGREGLNMFEMMMRVQEDHIIASIKNPETAQDFEMLDLYRKAKEENMPFDDFMAAFEEVSKKYPEEVKSN